MDKLDNMLTELNENKLIKIRVHLKTILEEGLVIANNYNSKLNVYESLFKRFISCFHTFNALISDFDNDKKYKAQSIAVVLRASLLDYLLILYLKTFYLEKKAGIKSKKSSYDEEVNKLLSEQIRRMLTVSDKDKNTSRYQYDHDKFCKFVDLIYHNFKPLFDDTKSLDYNKPYNALIYKRRDDISPSVIRKRLDDFSENLKSIDYLKVFSLYDIYSKYDHFGVSSMLLEHTDINDICEDMFWSIFHIVDGITFCIDLLRDENGEDESIFEKMGYEMSCLKGVVYLSEKYKEEHR